MAAAGATVENDGEENGKNEEPPANSSKRKEHPTEIQSPEGEEKDQAQLQPQQGSTSRKKKRKGSFIYGNYWNYYGYRIDRSAPEDPRLAMFRKEWFEGKDCLDIGCNQGLVTIDIARKFHCRSIVGIDIDKGLIESAVCNLRKVVKMGHSNLSSAGTSEADKSKKSKSLENEICPDLDGKLSLFQCSAENENIDKRVSFLHESILQIDDKCSKKYDTVLCLSVTKWIHLNWGDDGLLNLFAKIWRLLQPGGIFILEPQPWSSYKKNRLVSQVATANFNTIQLDPSQFCELLLDKVGFKSAKVVSGSLVGTVIGFDRPIIVFYK